MFRYRRKIQLLVHMKKTSNISQTYRALRTKLNYMLAKRNDRTLLVTSSVHGEGKTTVASNLGIAFALEGKKVVIIDANLRQPTLHHVFSLSKRSGLGDYLESAQWSEEMIQESSIPNLFILPGNPTNSDPSELLGSSQMEYLLSHLAEQFDLILIDSPPITKVTDGLILSGLCDAVLIVVKSGKVKAATLLKVKEAIECVSGTIIGTVLNQVERRNSLNSQVIAMK
ncbi:CpsD/CapB family tyrosine-protein kinase [Paenibacillus popilliae]|uniref:non-specific protein-tyrosine kinase n=1 Tax=Paenibacillus popilliae TaxID=78057 RepID=A0ABY3AK63_PAEPP|nr:CpsD/CapB family tyrosine-protein kinase [Paenibacillus sp. SDF0028]TQR42816.1 polysaccharide biosynthesis tyrosine autokinase [Paenibacillus sp. SDF0028]